MKEKGDMEGLRYRLYELKMVYGVKDKTIISILKTVFPDLQINKDEISRRISEYETQLELSKASL